jgi:hypothetical protein
MDGSIRLSKKERKIVLHAYRHAACARTVRRALVLVLLDRGWSYREIAEATLVSHETIAGVKRAYLDSGVEAALGHQAKQAVVPFWLIVGKRAPPRLPCGNRNHLPVRFANAWTGKFVARTDRWIDRRWAYDDSKRKPEVRNFNDPQRMVKFEFPHKRQRRFKSALAIYAYCGGSFLARQHE